MSYSYYHLKPNSTPTLQAPPTEPWPPSSSTIHCAQLIRPDSDGEAVVCSVGVLLTAKEWGVGYRLATHLLRTTPPSATHPGSHIVCRAQRRAVGMLAFLFKSGVEPFALGVGILGSAGEVWGELAGSVFKWVVMY